MLKQECLDLINNAVKSAIAAGELGNSEEANLPEFKAEVPKNRDFGDIAVNISCLCRFTRKSPIDTAKSIVKFMEREEAPENDTKELENCTVHIVGGFINFKITLFFKGQIIRTLLPKKE